MSEQTQYPKDRITVYVDGSKVFLDENGNLCFNKTITVEKWNSYLRVFEKHPELTKTERITPETLGYSKKETWEIYVYKTVQSEALQDETVYYSMTLTFEIPSEARYKTAYFKKAKSGRVFLAWFDSGTCSEVSINDKEFTSRGKAVRLKENTILQKGSPIFTLNGNGELERRLSENDVW